MIFGSSREEQHTQKVAVEPSAVTTVQLHYWQGEGQVMRVREDNFYGITPVNERRLWRNNMPWAPNVSCLYPSLEAHRTRQAESLVMMITQLTLNLPLGLYRHRPAQTISLSFKNIGSVLAELKESCLKFAHILKYFFLQSKKHAKPLKISVTQKDSFFLSAFRRFLAQSFQLQKAFSIPWPWFSKAFKQLLYCKVQHYTSSTELHVEEGNKALKLNHGVLENLISIRCCPVPSSCKKVQREVQKAETAGSSYWSSWPTKQPNLRLQHAPFLTDLLFFPPHHSLKDLCYLWLATALSVQSQDLSTSPCSCAQVSVLNAKYLHFMQ